MAKLIIEKVNTNSVEVIGKTCDSFTFSGDVGSREKIKGQTYLTVDDVDDNMTVRGDNKDNLIRKVTKVDKVELGVQLLNAESIGDGKSLATVILRDVYTSKGRENPDLDEIFVKSDTNTVQLGELLGIADKMARTPTGDRAGGKWYPIKKNGGRVIIRIYDTVNNKGRICDGCCDSKESCVF